MTDPCKVCLPGAPRHQHQRVVIRDGQRVQICERCHVVIGFLPPLTESETPAPPDDRPDYEPTVVLTKLRQAWRSR